MDLFYYNVSNCDPIEDFSKIYYDSLTTTLNHVKITMRYKTS